MGKLTGKATIRTDGNVLATENGATLNVGGIQRQGERHGGRSYYKEEEANPSMECMVLHGKDTDIIALSDITGATVEFETDTGQTFILRGAFTTESMALDTGTGKSALKMEADSVDRV